MKKIGNVTAFDAILVGPLAELKVLRQVIRARWKAAGRSRVKIIAIDGGLRPALRLGKEFSVDHFIGDGDSLGKGRLPKRSKFSMNFLNPDKAASDTWFAASWAISHGARSLHAVGLTGGRADHEWAVILDFSSLEVPTVLEDSRKKVYFLNRHHEQLTLSRHEVKAHSVVSIFSISDQVKGLTLRGFQYELQEADLWPGSRGLSNRLSWTKAQKSSQVRLRRGRLIVVVLKTLK